MSSEELKVEEAKITVKMDELSNLLKDENVEFDKISKITNEIVGLVNMRNNKCKLLK